MKGSRSIDSIKWDIFTYGLGLCGKSEIKYTFSQSGIRFLTCLGVFPLLSSSILFSMAIQAPSRAVFLDQKPQTAPGLSENRRNIRESAGLSSTSEMKQLLSRRARGSTRGAAGGEQERREKSCQYLCASRPNCRDWQHFKKQEEHRFCGIKDKS